jgi:DNA-binding NtrC family response regulator
MEAAISGCPPLRDHIKESRGNQDLPGKILSIGHNSTLLRLRNKALQRAGYDVTTTKETALVLELARKKRFDAVVLCCSISPGLRKQIAHELKQIKPGLPVIVLCHDEEYQSLNALSGMVVVAAESSHEPLINALTRALREIS